MNRRFLFFLVIGIIGGLIIIGMTIMIFHDNIKNTNAGFYEIYIPSNTNYEGVLDQLLADDIVKNIRSFDWVALRMNYPNTVEAGKFLIPNTMSNKALVTQLRNGFQEQSVKIAINTINSKADLYERIESLIEADSHSLSLVFENDSLLRAENLNKDNGWAIVLADTYQFHWDTDAKEFFNRMHSEFNKYWNEDRQQLASNHELSPIDCVILASIIEKESIKTEEYKDIAGVYINRLKDGWPLQADPTVKFAMQRSDLKRILREHTEFDSPYNTYKYKGIPPGPIGLPEKSTIEAVLHAKDHDFMYFCAKDDFSGYHVFAKTLREHERNANNYRKALNKNGIF